MGKAVSQLTPKASALTERGAGKTVGAGKMVRESKPGSPLGRCVKYRQTAIIAKCIFIYLLEWMYSAIASSLWGQLGETEDEPDSYLAFTASATPLRVHQQKAALIFSPARTPTLGSQPKFCLDSRISEPKWTSAFPSSGRREVRGSLSDSFLLMNCVHLLSETHTHSHTQAHTWVCCTQFWVK